MPKVKNWSKTDISYRAIGENKIEQVWENDITGDAVWLHKSSGGLRGPQFYVFINGSITEQRDEVVGGEKLHENPWYDREDARKAAVDWMRNHPLSDPEDFNSVPESEYPSAMGWELTDPQIDRLEYSYHFEYDGTRYVADLSVVDDGFDVRIEMMVDGHWKEAVGQVKSVHTHSIGEAIEEADEYMSNVGKHELVEILIEEDVV